MTEGTAALDDAGAGGVDRRFVAVLTGFTALGGFLFGYDTGVINGALDFIQHDFDIGDFGVEIVTSAVLAGALLGAAMAGRLADRHGRRPVIMAAGALYVIGALGSAAAFDTWFLILARLVVGLAIGYTSTVAPLYIAEVAPAARRGGLVALYQLAITVGILVATLVDEAFSHDGGWRWMLGLAAIPGAVQLFGMARLPDTPRWLCSRGRDDDARAVLAKIAPGHEVDSLAAIRSAIREESGGSWSQLLAPSVRPALVIGVTMAVFQQITGINAVIYYDTRIFQEAGFTSTSTALLAALVVASVNVLATFIAIRYLDRVGRRPLLMAGLVGMTVSLAALGLAFAVLGDDGGGVVGWIAIAMLCAYIASFAFSLGPIVWVLISEIFPTRVRGIAISVATMANWAANLVVALTFLTITDELGPSGTFWIFGVLSVLALVYVRSQVPETKGKSLEQIEASWVRRAAGSTSA